MSYKYPLAAAATLLPMVWAACGGPPDGMNKSAAASRMRRPAPSSAQASKEAHASNASKPKASPSPVDGGAPAAPTSLAYRPDCAFPALTFTQASCWRADYKPFSAWTNLAPWAFWGVDAMRPAILVELGSHNGYSTFAFAQAIRRLGLSTRAYAVDTWAGDVHAGFYDNSVFEAVERRTAEHYSAQLTLLRMTFDEALGQFTDGSVDLLHIDGQHHYEDVKHDFETWLPKMSDRGVIYFHDIDVHERGFGVYQLWDELTARYPHFSFHQPYGLGILGVGRELPPAFVNLFASTGSAEGACVEKIYKDLGTAAEQWEAPSE